MNGQSLDGVRAARGVKPARGWQGWRDPPAVEPQDVHQHPSYRARPVSRARPMNRGSHPHRRLPEREPAPVSRRSAPPRSSSSAALLAPAEAGSARTTTSAPPGSSGSRPRIRWRNRRCTRCRTTAPPTVRPTTKPTRDAASASSQRARCTTTAPHAARRPRRTAVAKSSRRVSREVAGSNGGDPASGGIRPTIRCGPCGVAQRGWRAPPGCAYATGTRESSHGDGCSAGTCAYPWSRLSFSRCSLLGSHVQGRGRRGCGRSGQSPAGTGDTTASGSPVPGPSGPWTRAHRNTRRWAGDSPSLGGRDRRRQNDRLASPQGRHAVTSMMLALAGFLWQHPTLVGVPAREVREDDEWRPTRWLTHRRSGHRRSRHGRSGECAVRVS